MSFRGIDAVLSQDDYGTWDVSIGDEGELVTEDSFDTYILTALFTDIRADESEVADTRKRGGWIGNESTPGFQMGSKLWLLDQSPLTQDTMNKAEEYATQALQVMIDERLAVAVSVVATRGEDNIILNVTIQRPDSPTAFRHYDLWENTGRNNGS